MRKKLIEKHERRTLELCFVCGKKITGEPVRLAKSRVHPEGLHRHKRCEPGSARWFRSDIGKCSDMRDMYPEPKEMDDGEIIG